MTDEPPPGRGAVPPRGAEPPVTGSHPTPDTGADADSPPPTVYPQQQLLPQEVQPRRSRRPLAIGLVVVMAMVAAAVGAYFLLRDDGEDTRAAYCSTLRDLTNDGDLLAAVGEAGSSAPEKLQELVKLAPQAVAGDWATMQKLASGGQVSVASALGSLAALRGIVDDANSECGLSLDLPAF